MPRHPIALAVAAGLVGMAVWWPVGLASEPLSFPLSAVASSLEEVVERLQVTCARTQDLSARFHQTVTNRSLGQVREGSGLFLLKRPGKMRWEYQTPEPRLFVTDGKTLWDYSPVDKQVRIQPASAAYSSRLPLAFLAGDCQVRRDFTVATVEHAGTRVQPNSRILDLRPKQAEAGVARMLLEINLKDFLVEKATLFDAVGNTTVIAFSDLKLNSSLSDHAFQFTPPPGVLVVTPPKP